MPLSDYTPNVEAVAAFIRARTKTRGGSEAGTFNPAASAEQDLTRPTAEQVNVEIANAIADVGAVIGADLPDVKFIGPATRVAALRAALLIELTYWPEQVSTGRSAYPQLKELYDEYWANLLASMGIDITGDGGAAPIDGGYASYGGFPTTGIGMETPW